MYVYIFLQVLFIYMISLVWIHSLFWNNQYQYPSINILQSISKAIQYHVYIVIIILLWFANNICIIEIEIRRRWFLGKVVKSITACSSWHCWRFGCFIFAVTVPRVIETVIKNKYQHSKKNLSWVRGLMVINVECEFRDRGSIPSVCQITDADLGQVG